MDAHDYYQRQHARFLALQQEYVERVAHYQQWQYGYLRHLHYYIQRRRLIREGGPVPFFRIPLTIAAAPPPVMVDASPVASSDMNEREWHAIAPLLMRHSGQGRPPADARSILNGILFHQYTHCAWRAIPPNYGNYVTCWRWQLRWENNGTLHHIHRILQREGYSAHL